jgi:arginyl-tRNA synthetase
MNSSIAQQIKSRFSQALEQAFGKAYTNTDPLIVPASNPRFGDYQCNISLSLAKERQQKPREVAETLLTHLDIADLCQLPEIAGPGFINLTLQPSYLEKRLNSLIGDSRLGVDIANPPQRIIVDFSSPNIAKEMHVGHLRSTIIGDCIARILEFRGHSVTRLNHVGDWGTQFGMLITYLQEAYPDALTTADALDLGDLVAFYKKAKIRFDADETFKEMARQAVVKLQSGDPDSRKAWKLLCDQSRREFNKIYDRLDIHQDLLERGESFYNPYLESVVDALDQQGLLKEDHGALCVFLDGFTNKEGDPLPLIVKKSDGGYNYATTDLAAIRYRVNEDQAQRIIYVTDAGQANHFAQVFQVAKKAGFLPDTVEVVHVPFGLVLGEDGKKLKTRSGDTAKLQDLLDEAIDRSLADLKKRLQDEDRTESQDFIDNVSKIVGLSAVKYADLSQNRNSNYIFSYDKMLNLQGNTAPYMLYAYARVRSIGREGSIDFQDLADNARVILQEEAELILAKQILQLSEVIQAVEQDLLPNRLCDYLYELSKKYNRFYESCPVLKSAEPMKTSRVILCDLTARSLQLGLSLLGIDVLERM